MTAILNGWALNHVFQASDRLVSTVKDDVYSPYHQSANKSVIVRAAKSFGVMAYTGLAYIGDQPTDAWLAATVLDTQKAPPGFVSMFNREVDFRPWFIATRIRDRLNEEQRTKHHLAISYVGAQEIGRRVQPFVWHISNGPEGGPFQVQTLSNRLFDWRRGFLVRPLGQVPEAVHSRVRAELRETGGDGGPQRFSEVMADGIRACASAAPKSVGPDVMSIHLDPTRWPLLVVHSEYAPQAFTEATFPGSRGGEVSRPAVYTPWIITPDCAWAPSIMDGPQEWTSGGSPFAMQLDLNAPRWDSGRGWAITRQDRPGPPR